MKNSKYSNIVYNQRLDAMFYMQTHWIVNKEGNIVDIESDFYLSFIDLLNRHEVEYLLIGGFAVNYYGHSRTTHDMNLWVNSDFKNSQKLLNAIDEFGFDISILKGVCLKNQEPIKLVHSSISFKQIKILADISGGDNFFQAFKNKTVADYKNSKLNFIGYNEFIKNKLESGRNKDIEDVGVLKMVKEGIAMR